MADGSHQVVAVDIRRIADALGITKRGALKRADKEAWPFAEQVRSGGKRRIYQQVLLPVDVQSALHNQHAIAAANNVICSDDFKAGRSIGRCMVIAEQVDAAVQKRTREAGQAGAAALTGNCRARMEAKLEILAQLDAFARTSNLGTCAAMDGFCDAFNRGALVVSGAVTEHIGADLCAATLRRWRATNKKQGPAALAGSYGNRKGASKIERNQAMYEAVVGILADKPHISAKLMFESIAARFPGADRPDLRSVERFLTSWKRENAEVFMALTNPDQWKNKFKSAFGSLSEQITRPCQLWMLDSTPADLLLEDGRYSLVGVVDLAWRGIRLHVTKTCTAESVCQIMRRAILDWGVPEAIKCDNGSDYASNRVATALAGLHIEARFSAPFSPWEKGDIERAFRTFSHSLLELLPGYVGHNVEDAQALRARASFADRLFKKNEVVEVKLTAAELQVFCDRWCNEYYQHETHSALDGDSPFQRYAQHREVIRRIDDVRALDLLLGEGTSRTVTKKGLRIDRLVYIAPELASVIGQQVQARIDDADIGRAVVYHGEQFLCIAECPEVAGVSRREIAILANSQKNAAIQTKKRELKALGKKANTRDLAWEILDAKRAQNASLTSMPAPNVIHITPALEAASTAADALEQHNTPRPTSEVTVANLESLRDAMRGEQVVDETSEDRFRRALRSLMKPEDERDELERRFLKNHTDSPEFRGRWHLFEDFGPSAFQLSDDYTALLPDGVWFDRLTNAQRGDT